MKISFTRGKQNKIHISVDGEYKFTVDAEYWFLTPYCRISEITGSEECEKFMTETGSRYAFISGLRVLSYGDNSRRDLYQKLIRKGHKAEYVNNALDTMEEYGYINDKRYAENTADRLVRTKHMSKSGIKSELFRKGISPEIIEETLEKLEVDPVTEIRALIQKKYTRYLGDEKGMQKIIAALRRLGYPWSDIKSALSEELNDTEAQFDD